MPQEELWTISTIDRSLQLGNGSLRCFSQGKAFCALHRQQANDSPQAHTFQNVASIGRNIESFQLWNNQQKGNKMSSDFSSRQVVKLIQISSRQMEKNQVWEEWIKQLQTWRLNGTECTHPTAKSLSKDYLSKMFFIKDDLLWVRVQTKGEPTRLCVVLPHNWIQDILNDEYGALFKGHEGVAKTRFNLT